MVQVISIVIINNSIIIITNNGPGPHFVVMEYLEHGDLTSFLASHLPEVNIFFIIINFIGGDYYCHYHQYNLCPRTPPSSSRPQGPSPSPPWSTWLPRCVDNC